MKTISYLSCLILLASILACGGSNKKTDEKKEETSMSESSSEKKYKRMYEVDLSEYNIPATINIPDESFGKTEIRETSWGSVEIEVGDRFGLEIVPFGMTVEEFKNEIMSDLVYQINFTEDSDRHLVYKRSIADSDVEPEFHFFMNKEINGDLYEIKSMSKKEFKESAVDLMVESADSFKGKTTS